MAMTRRQFIQRVGLASAGGVLGPSFFRNPLLRQVLAETIGDRYFIVLFLNGGNDGLNTVTPVSDGSTGQLRTAYEAARNASGSGGIRLLASELSNTLIGNDPFSSTPLALHPGFRNATTGGLWNLYNSGKVAVIQGCGYPVPNLSHDQAAQKWASADPLNTGFATGWMGRYLAANYGSLDIPAVNIRSGVAREYIQYTTSVLATTGLQNFGFPYDTSTQLLRNDIPAKSTAFSALYSAASGSGQPTLQYCGTVGTSTYSATQVYPQLHTDYTTARKVWSDQYDQNSTSTKRDLREIAKVIYGVINGKVTARLFELNNGGYDTHSDQGGAAPNTQHYNLHKEISDAIELFYHDCEDMGVANKICIMVWSEFSRRIKQNDNGTDHGTQGPMFVIGGSVLGGIYGHHPNIAAAALDSSGNTTYSQAAGNPNRSTDLRDVYGTILKHWLGMTDPLSVLPIDTGTPSLYWTAPNFDMAFLP